MVYVYCIISFILGGIVSSAILLAISAKKGLREKEELIKLKALYDTQKDLQEIIKNDFVKIANETIKNEQEDLRKQNRETLEQKILPLSKEIEEFKSRIEKFNITGVENTAKLSEQIANLEKNNKVIQQEAKNLTEALTKNQNIKGSYGENLLEMVLESCGMKEGIHYSKQFRTTSESSKDGEEHRIRPDVVINLPDNRNLVIDSKVTLTSWLNFCEDETTQQEFKTEVRKRINDLSEKNYQGANNLYQPDFVLMYVPIEPAVSILYEDVDLIRDAYKANIIIVGTSSLLTTIRLVNQLMAQQKQSENIRQIINAGTNLYETFVQFCDDLIDLQKKFEGVYTQLGTTINRFKRNNKSKPSLFSQVEKLKEYGISTQKAINEELLAEIEENEEITGVING